jgi:hypothetical protein
VFGQILPATARMMAREVKFVTDSPLEGSGFEPSVPCHGSRDFLSFGKKTQRLLRSREPWWRTTERPLLLRRNGEFEFTSLQRRVRCEPDFLSRVDHAGEVLDVLRKLSFRLAPQISDLPRLRAGTLALIPCTARAPASYQGAL